MNNLCPAVYGWDTPIRSLSLAKDEREATDFMKKPEVIVLDVLKGLGYIPVINVIIGVIQIIQGAYWQSWSRRSDPNLEAHTKASIELISRKLLERGVITLFAGSFLLIVDMIKTIYDCCQAKKILEERKYNNLKVSDWVFNYIGELKTRNSKFEISTSSSNSYELEPID